MCGRLQNDIALRINTKQVGHVHLECSSAATWRSIFSRLSNAGIYELDLLKEEFRTY